MNMNKKKIILMMVVILVIIGIMITIRRQEVYVSRNITFGDQCIVDEDWSEAPPEV